ncbi:MAG: 2-oxoacid:acceptor oxidoreductase subunit alpha [Bdellovibrionales bacterium]|nr:2-oxoacid:acceptor oxidoreductase subunit alpha [Bdellovibrionales bacterium]
MTEKQSNSLEVVSIRFAGDSGDGMQLTGSRFTASTAIAGNDLATQPDFPAEIRAPAGSIPGVSSFQIQFGSVEIFTAGDKPDVLVAMNPAALAKHIKDLKPNGTLICNSDAFSAKNLSRVGYESNPLEEEKLKTDYNLISVDITSLTHEALKELGLSKREMDRSKNFFALGIVCWLYGRSIQVTKDWLAKKFERKPDIAKANTMVLEAGVAFAQASELFPRTYVVGPAQLKPGRYRNVTGNQAIGLGLVAAAHVSKKTFVYGSYPITPASDILHEVSKHKNFGLLSFQAEDEIAACGVALGASYAGHFGVTASSGPGIILKQEMIGLAAMAELPLLVIDVQRAGPSTGMPTRTEQTDLLEVLYGRNGECPCVVIAIASPEDAFDATYEACQVAMHSMVPVFLMSDASIATGSQPWLVPDEQGLKPFEHRPLPAPENFQPYARDPKTLARPWVAPGTKGYEHRLGGLEKQDGSGNISYDPKNHEHMTAVRAAKVQRIADSLPKTQVDGAQSGDLLVIGWGSTHGAIAGATAKAREEGLSVAHVHLRYLNPLPNDLEEICKRFKKIVVPELNTGQLTQLLRARYLVDAQVVSKVQGQPFHVEELLEIIRERLGVQEAA